MRLTDFFLETHNDNVKLVFAGAIVVTHGRLRPKDCVE